MRAKPVRSPAIADPQASGSTASAASLDGLSWLNFLVAMMMTGFGTFLAVNLTAAEWSRTDVGLALSVAGAASLLSQVPGGALVDAISHKRVVAALAILAVISAAALIAFLPLRWVVLSAMALQGMANAVLTPAIAAITLALVPHSKLSVRLAQNVRYAALGGALAAAAIGVIGALLSHSLALLLAGAFGVAALVALRSIAAEDLDHAPVVTDHFSVAPRGAGRTPTPSKSILRNPQLLVFAACMLLFELGNAGVLPLAVSNLIHPEGGSGDLVVTAAVILAQLLAAILSTPLGRLAERWGRRPVFMLGIAALPIKAILFAFGGSGMLVIVYQSFDALSGAALGLMVPLVVADITRRKGHFNLAMGMVGLAVGLGGSSGTTVAGALADRFGVTPAFLCLAMAGLASCLLAWAMLRETQAERPARAGLRKARAG